MFKFCSCCRTMCLIDFAKPLDRDDDNDLVNGEGSVLKKILSTPVNGRTRTKRKVIEFQTETKYRARKNFEFFPFREPVLFIGHLSENSLLIIEKPWREVVKTFDAPPVHRHIFGT